jgi:2'-5' RNA ligase
MESYIWVFLPPEPAQSQVSSVQEELRDRFGLKKALLPPVHISLPAKAPVPAAQAGKLLEISLSFTKRFKPIPVELTGFQAFGNHTISLKVRDNQPFRSFWRPFREQLRAEFGFSAKAVEATVSPHVTVAFRDLTPEIFAAAWPELMDRTFNASFTLSALQLYKYGSYGEWVHVAELPLLGEDAEPASQGTLFQLP